MNRVSMLAFVIAAPLLLIAACAGSDSPGEVANDFWSAVMEGDRDEALNYVRDGSEGFIHIRGTANGKEQVVFGAERIAGDHATVDTTLLNWEEGDRARMEIQTHLVLEGGEWKVDFVQTMMSSLGGAMDEMMEEMGQAMQNTMDQLADEMKKHMGEDFAGMGQ